jgi:hypothetical protein
MLLDGGPRRATVHETDRAETSEAKGIFHYSQAGNIIVRHENLRPAITAIDL